MYLPGFFRGAVYLHKGMKLQEGKAVGVCTCRGLGGNKWLPDGRDIKWDEGGAG